MSGEGCFKVIVAKASNNKVGFRVLIGFQVYQHMASPRDDKLMTSLITYFGCGMMEKDYRNSGLYYAAINFQITMKRSFHFLKSII